MPDFSLEKLRWNEGYHLVAGIDEAGRGCLAGPVVAAAVILSPDTKIDGLNDSKKLSATRREGLLKEIQAEANAIGVGVCSPAEIDELNILWAAMEAMRRAAAACSPRPDFLLIDGNRSFPDSAWPLETVVKGDQRSLSIAAASIVAKVTRDHMMALLHEEYPAFGWAGNAGYPTAAHYDALHKHGPTPYHRQSFRLSRQS